MIIASLPARIRAGDDERGALRPRRSAVVPSGEEPPRSRIGFPWSGLGLLRSTRKGFATQTCDLSGFAYEVTAPALRHVGACRAGMVPAQRRELTMLQNLKLAQENAFNLARALMVPVVLFQVDDAFGVMVSSEYDGEEDTIVHEYDPWSPAH